MLVISSCLDVKDAAHGRGRLHEMINQSGAAASVAQRAATAYTPKDLKDLVAEAFACLASQRPRPCYIEVPIDVLKMPAGEGWTARALPRLPQADPDQIAGAIALLESARRPAIVVGGGARRAGDAVRRIAEATGAIIFTTIAAKGAVPSTHPLCAGSVLPNPQASKLVQDADVVLAAGSEVSETDLWYQPFAIAGKLIRIDIDPATLARPHVADLPILADAASALAAIAAGLGPGSSPAVKARQDEIRRLKEELEAGDDDLHAMLRRVLGVIRKAVPGDAIIASDMTQIAYAANEMFPADAPSTYLHPAGFGTLGWALPAAIGARAGIPDRPVVAIAGDYGLQYTINELGTAAEMGEPLIVLLWNNNALAQIRDDMVKKGIQPNAVSLRNPDFSLLAKAYGIGYARPETLKALATAIVAGTQGQRTGCDRDDARHGAPGRAMTQDRRAAVIFDVDGPLLELTAPEEDAFFVPFERLYGLTGLSRDWDSYQVRNDEDIIAEILERHLGAPAPHREVQRVVDLYGEVLEDGFASGRLKATTVPGADYLLARLGSLPELALGMATANLRRAAEIRLAAAGLWDSVRHHPGAADGGGAKRDVLARVIAGLGLVPDRIVFIGDNLNDLDAGQANGTHFIGFHREEARRERLSAHGATHVSGDHDATFRLIGQILGLARHQGTA